MEKIKAKINEIFGEDFFAVIAIVMGTPIVFMLAIYHSNVADEFFVWMLLVPLYPPGFLLWYIVAWLFFLPIRFILMCIDWFWLKMKRITA